MTCREDRQTLMAAIVAACAAGARLAPACSLPLPALERTPVRSKAGPAQIR
jgi:hypothetical protein